MNLPGGQPRPQKVLVVDDHDGLRGAIAGALTRILGAEITQAGDIPEALELMARVNFDVVLMDIHLPSGLGFDVVETVRAHLPHARLVLMTAGVTPADRARADRAGVDALVDKAGGPGALADALRESGIR